MQMRAVLGSTSRGTSKSQQKRNLSWIDILRPTLKKTPCFRLLLLLLLLCRLAVCTVQPCGR